RARGAQRHRPVEVVQVRVIEMCVGPPDAERGDRQEREGDHECYARANGERRARIRLPAVLTHRMISSNRRRMCSVIPQITCPPKWIAGRMVRVCRTTISVSRDAAGSRIASTGAQKKSATSSLAPMVAPAVTVAT